MDDTSLLAPISAEAPCGPDLEYDAAFLALEHSLDSSYTSRAVGPEGDSQGPEWKGIADQAKTLLGRSHDLRVAVTLTKAWLNLQGLAGLARGLSLLQQLLSLRWGSVHPQIGAQGDTDGLMRVNALRGLCDAQSVLAPLRSATLLRARGLPGLCLRDLELAMSGKQPEPGQPDTTVVEASFIGCDLDDLALALKVASDAQAAASALEQLFREHNTPAVLRLTELSAQLDAIESQLGPRVRARRAALAVQDAPDESAAPTGNGHDSNGTDSAHAAAGSELRRAAASGHAGPATSRAEVLRELDRLCAYYDQHEPASPVPMLLRRAKRLASMSFIELVRELAPGGIAEIETLRGPETENSNAENP
jgi:type VI secretion system protein ImpA